jgi:uncharacterized delta-60 repeat protein
VKGLRVWVATLFAFVAAVALPASATAAPGQLDTTFGGGDGKVITNVTDGYDWTVGLALQGDGKIVTAGQASGSGGRFYVLRYDNDGNLDNAFGGDGVVFTNFTPRGDYGYDVTVDNNGKILVVGGVGGSGGRFGLARYDPNDGQLDPTFGGDGKVTTNFTAGDDYADDVALVDADTIVVSGTANFGRDSKFALAQYDMSDGHLDSTFDGDGRVTTNLTRRLDGAWGVAVQSGLGIVATGPAGGKVGLVRYTLAGALDNTFGGGDGIRKTDWSSGLDWADEIALDGTGKIVVVGIANVFGNDAKVGLGRYTADGTPDFTKLTNLTGGVDYGLDVQIEPATQKIVATGAVRNGRQSFVTRYLSN